MIDPFIATTILIERPGEVIYASLKQRDGGVHPEPLTNATSAYVVNGTLVSTKNGQVICVFAPGTWHRCWKESDPHANVRSS